MNIKEHKYMPIKNEFTDRHNIKLTLKSEVKIKDFIQRDKSYDDSYYYLRTNKYISKYDYIRFKSYMESKNKELGPYNIKSYPSASYFNIKKININLPSECFDIIDLGPIENPDTLFDFQYCTDYFIYNFDSTKELNALIVEAKTQGYTIKSLDLKHDTIEMHRIQEPPSVE